MSSSRKTPRCSHCLEEGHTKASPLCPRKNMDPSPKLEKELPINRWNQERDSLLLKLASEGPIVPNWESISEAVGMAVKGCMDRYHTIVSPEEHVISQAKRLNLADIEAIIAFKKNICSSCKAIFYIPLHEWKGNKECATCYGKHVEEIETTWKEIEKYLDKANSSKCIFCERSRYDGIPLHFDHINMFEKEDTICYMVRRGETFETILPELAKCQVLCKSCHSVVTAVENVVGFRRAKTNLTREINGTLKGCETLSADEAAKKQKLYRDLYKKSIEPIYPLIKKLIKI